MFDQTHGRVLRLGIIPALCVLLNACSPAQPIIDLNGLRDELLPLFYTSETLGEIGWVPMRWGTINGADGFSVGDDPGSRLAAVVFGFPNERQVLVDMLPDDTPSRRQILVTFHEYVHQADYSGLLSRAFFSERLDRLRADPEYRAAVERLDESIDSRMNGNFLSDLAINYGDGIVRESMADMITDWVFGRTDLPDYVLEVYAGVIVRDPQTRNDLAFKNEEQAAPFRCLSGFYAAAEGAP